MVLREDPSHPYDLLYDVLRFSPPLSTITIVPLPHTIPAVYGRPTGGAIEEASLYANAAPPPDE